MLAQFLLFFLHLFQTFFYDTNFFLQKGKLEKIVLLAFEQVDSSMCGTIESFYLLHGFILHFLECGLCARFLVECSEATLPLYYKQ